MLGKDNDWLKVSGHERLVQNRFGTGQATQIVIGRCMLDCARGSSPHMSLLRLQLTEKHWCEV